MGDELSRDVLSLLKYAPLFLIFNGYWLMDNKQMFANKWVYKMSSFDQMPSGHTIHFCVSQAAPLLLIAIMSVPMLLFLEVIPRETVMKYGFSLSKEIITTEENLPPFFDVVQLSHAKEVICEYRTLQKSYGFENEESCFIEKL